eukprot:9962748-Lingulodinium_polyedra.AAC.1
MAIRALARRSVAARRHTKVFGVQQAAGKRRAVAALDQRLRRLRGQQGRYRALRRAGLPPRRFFAAAAVPSALHGVEVTGVADAKLAALRSAS